MTGLEANLLQQGADRLTSSAAGRLARMTNPVDLPWPAAKSGGGDAILWNVPGLQRHSMCRRSRAEPSATSGCSYGFFLDKEEFTRRRFHMSDEVLERYIRQLVDATLHRRLPLRGGRRADVDGPRLLPAGDRGPGPVPQAGHDVREHDPDQRDAAHRQVVRVPEGERRPGRHQHRRAEPLDYVDRAASGARARSTR